MFKRSLASLAAVAVASGAIVAPANAVTVTVNNDKTCTITPTDEETRLTGLTQTRNLDKGKAAGIIASIIEGQLIKLRTEIGKVKKKLAELDPNAAERTTLTSELKEKEKQLTTYQNLKDALNACIDGRDYNSGQSGDSKPPSVPKPPEDSVKPDDKRALPSNNGAVIGVIVAVLGILVAALPFIKSILPAQLRTLLP